MKNIQKKIILITVTVLALFINLLFSVLTVWINGIHFGWWYILWAASQVWLMLFFYANFVDPFLKNTKY
jgi:hypothetical protein